MSQRDIDELVEQIETDAFDAWAFNREQGQYMGFFDSDEYSNLIAAHDAAILERAADKMCKACEADCEPLCLGRHDCDLRRAIIEGTAKGGA